MIETNVHAVIVELFEKKHQIDGNELIRWLGNHNWIDSN